MVYNGDNIEKLKSTVRIGLDLTLTDDSGASNAATTVANALQVQLGGVNDTPTITDVPNTLSTWDDTAGDDTSRQYNRHGSPVVTETPPTRLAQPTAQTPSASP